MNEDKKMDAIKDRLGAESDAGDWGAIRGRFAKRASAEGLVDIAYEVHDSPFGPLVIAATDTGVVRVGLSAESEDEVVDDLARQASARILTVSRPAVTAARGQLDEYFDGRLREFDLVLDWQLARGFRREVLAATAAIPYGQTGSYTSVAVAAGSPKAVRAAGSALANNPLPIVVPCHRVLRSDGKVGNYLGGTDMKQRLLDLERDSVEK